MTWREISHEDGHVLVEYADGNRLNIRYDHLIEAHDPDRTVVVVPPSPGTPEARIVGTRYSFFKGDVLAEHKHDPKTLHDIKVERGTVIVHKESGDVTLHAGDRVDLKVNEMHSIEAVTDAVTLHTVVASWTSSSS